LDVSAHAPSAPGELVFTDEQLTLLAQLAGYQTFPGARSPQLEDAGWAAVAQGLAARGVIHDDDETAEPRLADIVLSLVLAADRWLWIRIAGSDEQTAHGDEILWFKEHVRIRQTVAPSGFHRFSAATADELVAGALELLTQDDVARRAPRALSGADAERTLEDARRITTVECGRRLDGSTVEAEVLTIATARDGALWLLGADDDGAVTLQPTSHEDARAQVSALAATLG
jgi:hypothetical protein